MFIGTKEQLDNSLEELGKRTGSTGKSICYAARSELDTLRAEVERMRRALGNIASMESVPGNIIVTAIAAIAKEALK